MVRILSLLTAALALTAQSTAVTAKDERIVLSPSSGWSVDFGATRCRLARTFGTGEDQHAIFFQQWHPSRSFAFTAAGPGFKRFMSQRETLVQFNDSEEPRETVPFVGTSDGLGAAVIYTYLSVSQPKEPDVEGKGFSDNFEENLPQLDIAGAQAATKVSLQQRSRQVVFDTGPLGEAFEVLNTCTQDLVKFWGLDVERHLTAKRLVKIENLQGVARQVQRDYPSDALRRGEQAILRVRVMVDETGKPTECVINEVTATKQLDSPACRPLMRAKYTPALDKDGEPFASYYTTSITYIIS